MNLALRNLRSDAANPSSKTGQTVIAGLSGGLGNQMFQYAAARSLALRLDVSLALDASWFAGREERRFALSDLAIVGEIAPRTTHLPQALQNLVNRAERRISKKRMGVPLLREQHFQFDPIFDATNTPVYLEGYWQSERYFVGAARQIRVDFQLAQPLTPHRQLIANTLAGSEAISVHVRRGDYVSNPTANAHHGTCSPQWYASAMAQMADVVSDPVFIVFSDDPDWARANLPNTWPRKFVEPQSDGRDSQDMHLMSMCSHHVIANSSFSWWGAWLNPSLDKTVIAPKRWFASSAHDTSDLLPPSWIKL